MSRASNVEKFVTEVVTGVKAGKTASEVAAALGIKVESVYARTAQLRKEGVKLPKFQSGPKISKVSALNKLIRSL